MQSEMKFTAGPWGLCPRFGGNENAVSIVGDDSIIATVWDRDAHGKEHPVSANARLIAAAPELFTALEDFDNWFSSFNPEDQASRMEGRKVVIRARAALASVSA